VDAGFEKRRRDRRVQMIRRDDRHRVDAVVARGLGARHLAVVRIAARNRSLIALAGQRAADRTTARPPPVRNIVEPRRDAMHRADEGAVAAADHAQPQPSGWHHPHAFAIRRQMPRTRFNCAVDAAAGEIVESPLGHADDVAADELRAFAGAVLGMLQAAFPFEHGPAGIIVLRQLREDRAEIDLAVAQRAEAAGAVDPAAVAAIHARRPVGRNSASFTWNALMRS
jgi:hypothetical protein